MTQSISPQVAEAERRLAKSGISLHRFCAGADVNPTTWWRWKVGKSAPNFATWAKVERHLEEVCPRDADPPAADAPTRDGPGADDGAGGVSAAGPVQPDTHDQEAA